MDSILFDIHIEYENIQIVGNDYFILFIKFSTGFKKAE